ncbi:sensor histidine kinase [Cupriavidus pinatubonensis]|uniref:HAMP domain-containing protein n=1 Tax=Cupriavidus pinatubonensis TaxID=248026 RepID=A0ABM8XQI1_9BURK|nr:histidine kinase [Cupriavidus pinatubonensis]CAG9182503.1 hypothetical protein LMG23994_04922 [Cupriavidus pinatubonensis]
MTMSRFLASRALWLSCACLGCALLGALWLARQAIGEERSGAAATAQLVARLSALQAAGPAERAAHLAALRAINQSARMRHLRLHVEDAAGRVLVDATPKGDLVHAESQWEIRARDGSVYHAALRWNPDSELREACGDVVGNLAMLGAYSVLLLCCLSWTARRAFAPLQQILDAIGHYERKDYSVRLPAMHIRELDQVRRALNHLAGALAQHQLERRALSRKLLDAQECERARLARELHDEFGQVLTAMRADAAYLVRKSAHAPMLQIVANDLAGHCARIQDEVRHLLHRLRPHGGQPDGRVACLPRLLQDLVRGWRGQPGQAVRLDCDVDLGGAVLDPDLTLTLYRMTQEALTNVMRHAGASRASICIVRRGNEVRWCVEDDGSGIGDIAAAMQRSHGLRGMQERAWAHCATLCIGAAEGTGDTRGCRLSAAFPLPAPAHDTAQIPQTPPIPPVPQIHQGSQPA